MMNVFNYVTFKKVRLYSYLSHLCDLGIAGISIIFALFQSQIWPPESASQDGIMHHTCIYNSIDCITHDNIDRAYIQKCIIVFEISFIYIIMNGM